MCYVEETAGDVFEICLSILMSYTITEKGNTHEQLKYLMVSP